MTKDELFRRLDEIRRLGYSLSDDEVTPGIAAIGAPIFDFRGRTRAVLFLSGVRAAILGQGRTTSATWSSKVPRKYRKPSDGTAPRIRSRMRSKIPGKTRRPEGTGAKG
jgi:Bacterial transcriptional regulator